MNNPIKYLIALLSGLFFGSCVGLFVSFFLGMIGDVVFDAGLRVCMRVAACFVWPLSIVVATIFLKNTAVDEMFP